MSYLDMKPGYYEMLQPGTPWHPGAPGWTKAPYPGWGNNPNLVGPRFLAQHGVGASPDGLGAYYQSEYNTPISGLGQPPPAHAYRDGSLGAYYQSEYNTPISGLGQTAADASARGAVLALLAIAGVFIAGAWIASGSAKRFARNVSGGRRKNYRRNARWTAAYKNRLPDSAFLLVEPGGHKERRGGKTYTVPKSLRKFPYKNVRGKVDLPHLRNAIARAPVADIPAAEARRIQRKARALLGRAHEGKVAVATRAR